MTTHKKSAHPLWSLRSDSTGVFAARSDKENEESKEHEESESALEECMEHPGDCECSECCGDSAALNQPSEKAVDALLEDMGLELQPGDQVMLMISGSVRRASVVDGNDASGYTLDDGLMIVDNVSPLFLRRADEQTTTRVVPPFQLGPPAKQMPAPGAKMPPPAPEHGQIHTMAPPKAAPRPPAPSWPTVPAGAPPAKASPPTIPIPTIRPMPPGARPRGETYGGQTLIDTKGPTRAAGRSAAPLGAESGAVAPAPTAPTAPAPMETRVPPSPQPPPAPAKIEPHDQEAAHAASSRLLHIRGEVCKALRAGAGRAELDALLKAEAAAAAEFRNAVSGSSGR